MVDNLNANYTNSESSYSDDLNNPEKKMPQNLEVEQSLLGSILFDNKILEDLPTNFDSQYFFDPCILSSNLVCGPVKDHNITKSPIFGYI